MTTFPWIMPVKGDVHSAFCKICLKRIKIDGQGIGQVKSHARCHKNKDDSSVTKQRTFVASEDQSMSLSSKKVITLPKEDQVVNAEILQALHFVDKNYSFASADTDSVRFEKMFPDSDIAKSYAQGKTKLEYTIKFGIAPYVREKLMNELIGVPYTFKFNETTTSQVKKKQFMTHICNFGILTKKKLLMPT